MFLTLLAALLLAVTVSAAETGTAIWRSGALTTPKYTNWDGSAFGTAKKLETNTGEVENQPSLSLWDVQSTPNQPPVLVAIGPQSTNENVNLTFGVSATDAESTPTLTTSALPSGASFLDNADGSGDFDWTPTYLQSGSYDITFYATDDSATVDSEVVTITVNEVGNQLPVLAAIGNHGLSEGGNLSFGVSATDAECTPALTADSLPDGASFIDNGDGTGTFDWTPDFTQSGSYKVVFYATDDSAATDNEEINIAVNEAGNQLPVLAAIGAKSTDENVLLSFSLSATDPESTPVITASGLPVGATLIDNGDGTGDFDWTPTFVQSGIYDVTFFATDQQNVKDSEIVTITVNEADNQQPVLAAIGAQSTVEHVNLNFIVSASDPESTPVLTTSALPSGAGFVDNGNGTGDFDWTPGYPTAGNYSVTFYATDDSSAVDSEIVLITVDLAPVDYIEVIPDSDTLAIDSTSVFTVSGFTAANDAAYPGVISWSLTAPIGTIDSLAPDSASFHATAVGDAEVVATSSLGVVDTSSLLRVIAGPLATLTISPDSVIVSADSSITFTATGEDAFGNEAILGSLTWEVIGTIGSIDASGLFTPGVADSGRIAVTSSLEGVVDTNQIVLVIPGEPVSMAVSPDSAILGTNDSTQFSAVGFDANGNATSVGDVNWRVLGRIGSVDSSGMFVPREPGAGRVSAASVLFSVADTNDAVFVEALDVTAISIGTDFAQPSQSLAYLLAFRIENYFLDQKEITQVTVRAATKGPGSIAERLSNIDSLQLYLDADNDSLLSAADTPLAAIPFSANIAVMSFGAVPVPPDSGRTFLVGATVNAFARDGDSLDLYLLPQTDILRSDDTTIVGPDSLNSLGYQIVDGMVASQLAIQSWGPRNITPTDTSYVAMAVDIPRNGYENDVLDIFSVGNVGTANESDLDSVILLADDGDGIWGGAGQETYLGALSFTGERWSISGLGYALTGPVSRLFLAIKLSSYPTDQATVSLFVPRNGIEVVSGNDGPIDADIAPSDVLTIETTETILLSTVSMPFRTLVPGQWSPPLFGLSAINDYATDVSINSIRLALEAFDPDGATQGQLDSQIDSVNIYSDGDGNPSNLSADDILLGRGTLANGYVLLDLGGALLSASGGSKTIIVSAKLNNRNCKNGNTINFAVRNLADISFDRVVSAPATFPLQGAENHLINTFPAAAITINPVPGKNLFGGQSDHLVLDFELPRNGYANDVLQQVRITNLGTIEDGEALSAIRLKLDVTGDGLTPDDYSLGSFSFNGLHWGLYNIGLTLNGPATRLFVTVDFAASNFDGGSLQFEIPVSGVQYVSGTDGPDDTPAGNPETHFVFPSERITAISIPSPTVAVWPGSSEVVALSLALYNGFSDEAHSLQSVALTNISHSRVSSEFADTQFGQVSVYLDTDGNRTFTNDSLLSTGYFVDGRLQLSGFDISLPPESLSYFFVVSDLPLNLVDSDSLAVAIVNPSDFTFAEHVNVNGDIPLTRGGYLVVNGSVEQQYSVIPLAPRTLSPGDTSVTLMAFSPATNGPVSDALTSCAFTNRYDADSSDLGNFKLWMDLNSDSVRQDTDFQIAPLVYFDGQWVAAELDLPVNIQPPVLFLTADVKASASPDSSFSAAIPVGGCEYTSSNDGPLDTAVVSGGTFQISNSALAIASSKLPDYNSVGQSVEVRLTVTNLLGSPAGEITAEIVSISDPSVINLDSSFSYVASLNAGEAVDFRYYFTTVNPGPVQIQLRAVAPQLPDSSATVTTNEMNVQYAPSDIQVQLLNTIPASVTRGQSNVFPLALRLIHPGVPGTTASLRVDSLRLAFLDDMGVGIQVASVASRLVLTANYSTISIVVPVPTGSSVLLDFDTPIVINPGEDKLLSLLVDINEFATATTFAIAVEDSSDVLIVDNNNLAPVSLSSTVSFPMITASCRIDDPSQNMVLSCEPRLAESVNFGQEDVPALSLIVRHPGAPGSSQIQLTGLTVQFTDNLGDSAIVADLLDAVRLSREQAVIGAVTVINTATSSVLIPLNAPITLSPGGIDSFMVLVTVDEQAPYAGFSLMIADSTMFVVRDLSSGSELTVSTDTVALATGSVFPIASGQTQLKQPASQPEICLSSDLPNSVIGGRDSLSLVNIHLDYQADSSYSSLRFIGLELSIIDRLGSPLAPDRLFDRIGFRISGGTPWYQPFVQMQGGRALFWLGPDGVEINPGQTLSLELLGDIEAQSDIDHFVCLIENETSLILSDATDTTRNPGLSFLDSCVAGLPFYTNATSIFLPAGRPEFSVQPMPAQIAYPGQSDVVVLLGALAYTSSASMGDLSLNNIRGRVVRVSQDGSSEVSAAGLFSAVKLSLNGQVVAVDSVFAGDSISLELSDPLLVSTGDDHQVSLFCDFTEDASFGNYRIVIDDSTKIGVTDENLATELFVKTVQGAGFPAFSAEISLVSTNLENSFTNYPNPFRPSDGQVTTIAYVLPEDARVVIELFTITGELVATIADNDFRVAGAHQEDQWDGNNGIGLGVVPGTYFCRITARFNSGREEAYRRKVAVVR